MKLFETLATHFGKKTRIFSMLGAVALAGAALTATPAAQAQVSFGFGISTAPRYYAPRPIYVAPPPVYPVPVYGYGYARPYAPGYGVEGNWAARHENWRAPDRRAPEWNRGPGYGNRP